MKKVNKVMVGLMVSSSLLGGVVINNNLNNPTIEAKSAKKASNKSITIKNGKTKVKVTLDKVQKYVDPEQDNEKLLLVSYTIKNLSSEEVDASPDMKMQATQTKDGVKTDLTGYSLTSDEIHDTYWAPLFENAEKTLSAKGATLKVAECIKLDDDSNITIKGLGDKNKGKIVIKDIDKMQTNNFRDIYGMASDSEE